MDFYANDFAISNNSDDIYGESLNDAESQLVYCFGKAVGKTIGLFYNIINRNTSSGTPQAHPHSLRLTHYASLLTHYAPLLTMELVKPLLTPCPHSSRITHHASLVTPDFSRLTHYASLLTHHYSLLTHYSSPLTYYASLLTHHALLITPHLSHLIPHASLITPHFSLFMLI